MAAIDTVLLKVASRCNLNCSYCYVYNMGDEGWRFQPKRMSPQIEAAAVDRLRELAAAQQRPFSVVLHGGEPLLLGPSRLAGFFGVLRRTLSSRYGLHLQTNGLLLDEPMLDVCADASVGISISLDGPEELNDASRVDLRGRGSHTRVMDALERLQRHERARHLFTGLLAVVDPTSDPVKIYDFFKSVGAPSVDFLYKDGNHDKLPSGKASADSIEYGAWMTAILDRYLRDPAPPRIRVLDDMLKLLLGGGAHKEGVGLSDYGILVIDTDGSIRKNDTLKSSRPGADTFPAAWSVLTHRLQDVADTPEFEAYHVAQRPTSALCLGCPDLPVCGGGMTAHRWSTSRGFDNPSIFCADQRFLIERMHEWIEGQGRWAA